MSINNIFGSKESSPEPQGVVPETIRNYLYTVEIAVDSSVRVMDIQHPTASQEPVAPRAVLSQVEVVPTQSTETETTPTVSNDEVKQAFLETDTLPQDVWLEGLHQKVMDSYEEAA